MKKEKQIGLSAAIKQHYRTAPLTTHFAIDVSDRVFGQKTTTAVDVWLYSVAGLCGVAILILCLKTLAHSSFPAVLIGIGISVVTFVGLSRMEILIWREEEHLLEKTQREGSDNR